MAERAGFEPAKELPPYTLSKRAPSTTRPPLLFYLKNFFNFMELIRKIKYVKFDLILNIVLIL